MRSIFILLSCAGLLSACATYTSNGLFGGYDEVPLSADTWRIRGSGNAITKRSRTNAIAFVRAAELAAENGYDRFLILNYDEWEKTRTYETNTVAETTTTINGYASTYQTGPWAQTNVAGTARSTTTVDPGDRYDISKPVTDIVVKFVSKDAPDAANALLVRDVIKRFGPLAGYKTKDAIE